MYLFKIQSRLGPGHTVLDGDPAPLSQKGAEPQFSAHLYCGQTAGYIKMPLDMEVGLIPGDSLLDGDPASLRKRGRSPQFSANVYCGTPGCTRNATWYGGRPQPRRLCVRWDPAPLPKRGRSPSNFRPNRPMSVVAKRPYVSGYH